MTLLRDARGQRYLAAAWTGPAEQPGEPLWQITDVIRVPPVPDDYILAWGSCSYLGRGPDPRLAAVVLLGENKSSHDVIWARFISPASLEFEPARPEAVSCPEIDLRARS